ncbi:PREDICTED: uncharacterized protein LOC107095317 isoform X7 [Cyprinodon variegatus]|uniref:uncharacterized protein LOC107095317 isoform X7 n=1 Tax=Cyprinodon variegatus TaxID=28743 RepID=UPI000742941C|nr:PREDICTED: uncharacterized protein LOC107095317 isoform X7 [Cyprinodon variegatus]
MIRLNYLSLSDLEWNIEKWSMQQRIAAARLGDIRVCGTPQSRHTAGQLSSCLTSPHTMEALIVQPHEDQRTTLMRIQNLSHRLLFEGKCHSQMRLALTWFRLRSLTTLR